MTLIDTADPILDSLTHIHTTLTRGGDNVAAGLAAGLRASHALQEVVRCLDHLEPGPALILTEALERGLAAS